MFLKMNMKKLFWTLPFLSFILGYYLFLYFFPKSEFIVPNITGKNLQESIRIISNKNLNLHLLKEFEDSDLPEGIILSQSPLAGQKIKKNQNIFITVSKKPKSLNIPNFLNKKQKKINKEVAKLSIKPNYYWVNSFYPTDICIGQYPQPNKSLDDKKLVIYFSSGNLNYFIVPNLEGCNLQKIYDYLDEDKIILEVFYKNRILEDRRNKKYYVTDQKPMAGSIVDLSKKLYVQVQVDK
ncbi:PASTA domain-containing protein [Candidatus Dependentiae bacterium]|nr:PASTA domain-containing protein [Candidatus Dependentiae bacterium]